MIKLSRRVLARWAADQLLAGVPAKKIAKQLAAVLTEQKNQGQAEQLAADVRYELESRHELAIVQIASARPLGAKQQARIERQIAQATATKKVSVELSIDKSIIGGLRLETASRVWDQSLRAKLVRLREVA